MHISKHFRIFAAHFVALELLIEWCLRYLLPNMLKHRDCINSVIRICIRVCENEGKVDHINDNNNIGLRYEKGIVNIIFGDTCRVVVCL